MAGLATGNGFPNVVVTGVAMTTALATDADSTWKKLLDGQSGIRKLEDPFVEQYDLPVRIGGHLLEDFDGELTRSGTAPAVVPAEDVHGSRPAGLGERGHTGGRHPTADGVDRHGPRLDRGVGLRIRRHARERACGRSPRWRCRSTCRTRRPPRSGLEREAKAGVITPVSACASGSEGIAHAWRKSCSARPMWRSAVASRP